MNMKTANEFNQKEFSLNCVQFNHFTLLLALPDNDWEACERFISLKVKSKIHCIINFVFPFFCFAEPLISQSTRPNEVFGSVNVRIEEKQEALEA